MAPVLAALLILLGSVGPASKPIVADPDAAALRGAGIQTDDASLLNFFRQRTPSRDGEARLQALVRQLGDRSFRKRQQASATLLSAGRAALPFLLPALHDHDPEIAARARRCIQALNKDTEIERLLAATRLLARHKTTGGAAVLLAYLPYARDERIESEVMDAVTTLAWTSKRADARVVQALTDPQPLRRAAAALALGRSKDHRLRESVGKLLHDPDAVVRLNAARGLLIAHEVRAIPALIDLLADGHTEVVWQAEDILYDLAGEEAPKVTLGPPGSEATRKAHTAWVAWWDKNKTHFDLARLERLNRARGFTLLVAIDGYNGGNGQVWEVTRSGHTLWAITDVHRPMDARVLPGNRVLIAEYGGRVITIRDRHTGKIEKSYPATGNPNDVQLLPNGHIFADLWPNGMLEVGPDSKSVFSYTSPHGSITSAKRLNNGHVVYVTQNGFLAEIDAKGKELRLIKFKEPSGWRLGLDVLPGPRYLIAHQGANKVIEYDATGKPLWQCAASSPTQVTRLKNGHVLITCNNNLVIEVNRAGKTVWEQHLAGRPFRARRR